MAVERNVAKDFFRLQKNIGKFTDDEARITEFDDDLTYFCIQLCIKDGYYTHGIFDVKIIPGDSYPSEAPEVDFLTEIYHPNIGNGFHHREVCLNLLSEEWSSSNDLEDVVHGLLFLVKNPAFDDILNPHYSGEMGDDFQQQVTISLEGGTIDEHNYTVNPGFVLKDKLNITADNNNTNTIATNSTDDDQPDEGTTELPDKPPSRDILDIIEISDNKWTCLNFLEISKNPNNWLLHILRFLKSRNTAKDILNLRRAFSTNNSLKYLPWYKRN